MKSIGINNVYKMDNKLYTKNLCKGVRVYGESLKRIDGEEYRAWNPYRSKLAAAILKGLKPEVLTRDARVLYLGAATGTTVSHISDIVVDGIIYAVESSPFAMKTFLGVVERRMNIIPLLMDANHPERYQTVVPRVDLLYQDVSQRNQDDIFIKNVKMYLKPEGMGLLMVKTRSIDVALPPEEIIERVEENLRGDGFNVLQVKQLTPYDKDHAAILVKREN